MYSVNDLLNIIGKRNILGDIECVIDGLNLCDRTTSNNSILSYATNNKYIKNIKKNKALKVLIVPLDVDIYTSLIVERGGCVIFSETPETDFYFIHEFLCQKKDFYKQYTFESKIGNRCSIHESAIICDGVIIGNNVTIGALTIIKSGTVIDDDVTIGCNTVVGSEGFQVIKYGENQSLHVTHVGKVHICNNAYIGDCTCIANSLFEGETYIGKGAKIDNLVHIAHNLYIGENATITAHTILCGSSIIEKGAWIAPNCSVLNKVKIGEYAKVGLGSVVTKDIPPKSLAYGVPAKVKKFFDREEQTKAVL